MLIITLFNVTMEVEGVDAAPSASRLPATGCESRILAARFLMTVQEQWIEPIVLIEEESAHYDACVGIDE